MSREKACPRGIAKQARQELHLAVQRGWAWLCLTALVGASEFERFGDSFPGAYNETIWWQMLEHSRSGSASLEDLLTFLQSEHHHCLPYVDISSTLWADLLTGSEEVKESDGQDIDFMAHAIPISHFVVTDNRMRERIEARGLDERWGTKVFSMQTIDALFAELDAIPQK
ncbi:MAG: hypothetical protein ACLQDQ_20165 [Myxococcaceae bacterium]